MDEFKMDWVDPAYIVTPNGQPITGMQELNGRVYVFTRDATFVLVPKKLRWYERLWQRFERWRWE